jgi:hypothetical protein
MTSFAAWANFHVIVGSSAGALIGLQFVVITLVAGAPATDQGQAGSAFATPTIVLFGSCCFCRQSSMFPGAELAALPFCGGYWASVGSYTRSSWPGACERRSHMHLFSRIGYVIFCCRLLRMQRWPELRARLGGIFGGRYLQSVRCCVRWNPQRVGCRHVSRVCQNPTRRSEPAALSGQVKK